MCTAIATVTREPSAAATPGGVATVPVWSGDQIRLQRCGQRLLAIPHSQPPLHVDRAVCPFPYTAPQDIIVFMDDEGTELGWLVELDRLDAESRQALEAVLQEEYLIPRIERILTAKEEFDIITWQVVTDRGTRTIEIRGRRNIRWIGPGRVLVKDADGNRYEIPNVEQLDPQSRDIVDAEL